LTLHEGIAAIEERTGSEGFVVSSPSRWSWMVSAAGGANIAAAVRGIIVDGGGIDVVASGAWKGHSDEGVDPERSLARLIGVTFVAVHFLCLLLALPL